MGKFHLAVAAFGLLLALGASASAGGRSFGTVFRPPGWSHNSVGQEHAHWGTNSETGVQPPGWSRNTTGQTNGWNSSLVAPGLTRR